MKPKPADKGQQIPLRPRKTGADAAPKIVPPPKPLVLTPRSQRLTDAAMRQDLEYFKSLELAIDQMTTNGVPAQAYHRAKARAWLECARTEYQLRERHGLVEASVAQCTNLLAHAAEWREFPRNTPQVADAETVRPDLWELSRQLQAHPHAARGEATLARLEVWLIWAGASQRHQGWNRARPRIEEAEELAAQARQEILEEHTSPPQGSTTGTTAEKESKPRIDSQRAKALESRIQALSNLGVPLRSYGLAKAAAWLDFANDARNARDRSGVVREALAEADRLASLLESATPEGLRSTPMAGRALRVREDLWNEAARLAAHENFAEIAAEVGRLEVALVQAGYETRHLGAAHARSYVKTAERLASEAAGRLDRVAQPMTPTETANPSGTTPPPS
jgi:hypothetical protein